MTPRANRYHTPLSAGRAARAALRCRLAGASALMRGPSATSTAGSTISETAPADSATSAPPTPIEYRNFMGITSIEAAAPATASELYSTVRPAVRSVRVIAAAESARDPPPEPRANSSR